MSQKISVQIYKWNNSAKTIIFLYMIYISSLQWLHKADAAQHKGTNRYAYKHSGGIKYPTRRLDHKVKECQPQNPPQDE